MVIAVVDCHHNLEMSIKDVRTQRGLSSADIFRTRGSLNADVRTFLGAKKNVGFFEICGVSARTSGGAGVEPVRTFFRQGGGSQFFATFYADVFYGRLLKCDCFPN